MTDCDLFVSNIIYPATDDFTRWVRGDVAISDGVIADLGPELSYSARARISGVDLIMMPGLFNLHTHGQDMLWRGSRDDAGVDREWPEWFWPSYESISAEAHVSGAMATYLADARGGVTYLADHLRRDLHATPFAEALQRVGIRGRVYSHLAEAPGEPLALYHETSPWFETALEKAASLERRPIMIHAQETALRLDHVLHRFQRSTVELLDQYGLLHEQTFLVHMGHWSALDLDLIAARRAHIVITPSAEMKLGEKTCDPLEASARDISVLIGTDGPAYHNGEDLFADLKLVSLLASAKHGPGRLRPEQILAMATWKAADAVGQPRTFPEIGAVADLTLLDTRSLGLLLLVRSPFDNIAQQLVHGASREAVRFVIVGGRIVVEDWRSLTIAEADMVDTLRSYVSHHFNLY
jgi:cytosine/adenosine deaminase-related metal-dependent hydrolase